MRKKQCKRKKGKVTNSISLHRKNAKPINKKKCSILLVIREMQIITMIYPFTITKMAELKN